MHKKIVILDEGVLEYSLKLHQQSFRHLKKIHMCVIIPLKSQIKKLKYFNLNQVVKNIFK